MRLRIDKIWLVVVAFVLSVPSAHAQIVTANPLEWMALAEGKTNRIVCCKSEQIHDVDMDEGLEMTKHIDPDQFRVLRAMTR